MKRIAIINQRYGKEINGGSEALARNIAEKLSENYNVTVLTTCAENYITWRNVFKEGVEEDGAVFVIRFPVKKERNLIQFRVLNFLIQRLGLHFTFLEKKWVRTQGPFCPKLIQYINENKERFDSFLFVTYLYDTTVEGISSVYDKSILIPTAHDEYCIYFSPYRALFESTRKFLFLSNEEKKLVNDLFDISKSKQWTMGIGIETPTLRDKMQLCKDRNLTERYVIYSGRIDSSKGCDLLFRFFLQYKQKTKSRIKLVLTGKEMMDVPRNDDIISLGFISEEEKNTLISGAVAFIMPSQYESLSIAVLEALSLGVPILVNGKCKVLVSHVNESQAGFTFISYDEFENALQQFEKEGNEITKMKEKAKHYVREYYSWGKTIRVIEEAISAEMEKDEENKGNVCISRNDI